MGSTAQPIITAASPHSRSRHTMFCSSANKTHVSTVQVQDAKVATVKCVPFRDEVVMQQH